MQPLLQARKILIQHLWQHYTQQCAAIRRISTCFSHITWPLDHFALIDLPSAHSGIPTLNQLLAVLGYIPQGYDYLADKQNPFLWLAPQEALQQTAREADPQIVIADFYLPDCAPEIRKIIQTYTQAMVPFDWPAFYRHCGAAFHGDHAAAHRIARMIVDYCLQRRWPLPTDADYHTVHAANPLLAWVLVYGCQPSHFGLGIHLVFPDSNLAAFNQRLQEEVGLVLNTEGGEIKGGVATGIAQSATQGETGTVSLADGEISITKPFVELVWRYARCEKPQRWQDYFTGLIGQQANRVIEAVWEKGEGNALDRCSYQPHITQ